MHLIKVCGFTRAGDLEVAARCGVNAVGLNLVATSPRFLSLDQATQLANVAKQLDLLVFAVLMDPDRTEIERLLEAAQVDVIQLHGHEDVELAEACGQVPVVKALSWTGREEEQRMARDWSRLYRGASDNSSVSCENFAAGVEGKESGRLAAFLVDAHAPGVGGGTGRLAEWERLSPPPAELGAPLILAGGLRPDNVASGILSTRCSGVDTASGVEIAPGIKSGDLMSQFVDNAQAAFDQL